MKAQILNRSGQVPSDGWYQIEVTGEHPAGKDRRQVIDRTAIQSIVNRFKTEAKAENFPGILVDADHLSHDMENPTAAFAWLRDLEERGGQLYGQLDLTDLGEPAIKNRRYKFFSTEYDPDDIEDLGGGLVRPMRLAGLAFTNRPNNRGAKPISNRAGDEPGDPTPKQNDTTMKAIALALGLPETATEAEIIAKITSNAEELKTAKDKEAGVEADAILNRFSDRIPKEKRDDVRKKLLTNRADTEAMLELLPVGKAQERIFNRGEAKTPEIISGSENEAAEGKKAAAIRNRAQSISKQEGIPFGQAFGRAAAELA